MFGQSKKSLAFWTKAIILFLALTGNAFGELNPLSPTPLVRDKPPQDKTDKKHAEAAQDQRGTVNMPLFLKGEITTKKSETDTANDSKHQQEKSASDDALVRSTEELAFQTERLAGYTWVLVLIALFQAGFFFWQLILMQKGMKTAEKATDAARRSAEIAEKGLRLAERPQFNISGWEIRNFLVEEIPVIIFKLGNTGRSEAELIKCSIYWRISSQDPTEFMFKQVQIAGIIYPNSPIDIVVPLREITKEEYEALWATQSFIFLYAELSCTDTFDWTCDISMGSRVTLRKGVVGAEFINRQGVNKIRWYPPDEDGKPKA